MKAHQQELESSLQKAIIQAAARLFLKKGYHGVGMREIASESGASKALLYYHFHNKAELFYEILRDSVTRVGEIAIDARQHHQNAYGQIKAVFSEIVSWPSEQSAMIYLAKQEARHLNEEIRQRFMSQYHEQFIGRVQAILQDGMDRGEIRKMDAGLAVNMLLGMLSPVISSEWSVKENDGYALEKILDVFFTGILT